MNIERLNALVRREKDVRFTDAASVVVLETRRQQN